MTSETRVPRVDAQRNREAVIDAALDILAHNPSASMQTIAERSGVGRTTVYRHFPTRVDLVTALFERVIEEAQAVTERVIDIDAPAATVFRDLAPAIVGIGLRFQHLHEMRQLGDDVITESRLNPDDPVRRFLVVAAERGEIRPELPVQWIQTMISAITTATLFEVNGGRLDADVATSLLGEAFVRMFVAEGSAGSISY